MNQPPCAAHVRAKLRLALAALGFRIDFATSWVLNALPKAYLGAVEISRLAATLQQLHLVECNTRDTSWRMCLLSLWRSPDVLQIDQAKIYLLVNAALHPHGWMCGFAEYGSRFAAKSQSRIECLTCEVLVVCKRFI